jgi:hypothetical protein
MISRHGLSLEPFVGVVLLIYPCLENKQVDENMHPSGVNMKVKNKLGPFLAM